LGAAGARSRRAHLSPRPRAARHLRTPDRRPRVGRLGTRTQHRVGAVLERRVMPALLAVVATLATGLFAGAAVYITLGEHPARVGCGPAVAVREFRPSYRRAAVMQVALALVGTAAALLRFAAAGQAGWLVGGALLVSAIPFTLLVIMPTNARLLDESLDPGSAE